MGLTAPGRGLRRTYPPRMILFEAALIDPRRRARSNDKLGVTGSEIGAKAKASFGLV